MHEPVPTRPSARAAPAPTAGAGAGLLAFGARLLRLLLRLVLGLLGFALLMGALLMGLLLALGLVAWALLRGRRPAQGVFNASFMRARRRGPWPETAVIDIEAREVPERPGPAAER